MNPSRLITAGLLFVAPALLFIAAAQTADRVPAQPAREDAASAPKSAPASAPATAAPLLTF